MKLIRTDLYIAITNNNSYYLEADSLEEAIEMAREKTADFIKEVRWISDCLYRKSTKTITVEV
ncbi:hypothetical protein [Intestinibacter sp.]|uniref:hypothetical protein n=1 Tax=Intestinibacter sp. TaxID=1965304 RepID=UPI003F1866D1